MVSKKVYIATDTLVAFIDRAHPKHMHASAYFRYFAQNNFQIYLTIVSLNEAYHELYQIISPSVARDLLRAIELSNVNIIYPIESDVKRSIRLVATTQSVDLTFSKALMAVICDKYGIPQISTFSYMPQLFALKLFYLPI
jgi:predicted nucleic acid-binding protein